MLNYGFWPCVAKLFHSDLCSCVRPPFLGALSFSTPVQTQILFSCFGDVLVSKCENLPLHMWTKVVVCYSTLKKTRERCFIYVFIIVALDSWWNDVEFVILLDLQPHRESSANEEMWMFEYECQCVGCAGCLYAYKVYIVSGKSPGTLQGL